MPTPDPEGMSLLGKVIAAGTALATPIVWLWTKLDKKADKVEVDRQRDNIGKLFEKLDEHAQADATSFQKMFERMSDNHAEVLRALSDKADR